MSWEVKSLDNIITFQRGFDLPKTDFKVGDFPVVGSTGIIGFHNEFKVKSPCVVTGRSGTLGVFQYLNEDFWAHNTTLWVKEFQGNHPKFIYYLLQTLDFKSLNGGVAVPTLNRNVLKNVFISYPKSLETQKRIASILSNYEDLIENNLKRIKLLEETAQNIYKEWFVHFRFPNYEHTEFDAESGLPVGWEKINLYDFVEIKMGFPFKAEDFNEVNIGKPAIRIRDIPLSWTRTHTTQEVSEEYIVEQGDILIGMDGFFYLDIWRGQKGYLVQRVCRIRARQQNLQGFLLESLRQPISYYEKTISGATVAHLGAKHLKEIFINVPKDSELLEELKVFNRLNFQKINLSNQNQKLKEARDILLPRLMNRTIEV